MAAVVILRASAIALAALVAFPVWAQPRVDCAKATTAVEKQICATPELAKSDREMAALFATVNAKLAGPARDHFLKDQIQWNANRGRACTVELKECVQTKYTHRIARLKFLESGAYPFVSDQWMVRTGKVKATGYVIEAVYPQFDAPGIDFAAINREFVGNARKAADDSMPGSDLDGRNDMTYTYEQSFALHRPPGDRSISVEVSLYGFTGGAHGNGGTYAVLVDRRTGRKLEPRDVFDPASDWLAEVTTLVLEDLKKQFVQQPGNGEQLKPEILSRMLGGPGRWLFAAEHLQVIFNPYDVGPYAAGAYYVDIPYNRLRRLIRADGPIAR